MLSTLTEIAIRWQNVIGWLGVACFGKFVLKWSFDRTIMLIGKELRDAATLKWTPAGINGLLLFGSFLITILVLFLPTISKFFGMLNDVHSSGVDFNKALMTIVGGAIVSLLVVARHQGS